MREALARLSLALAETIAETPSAVTLRMERSGGGELPPFRAGQYVNLFVEVNGVRTSRPSTISSAPGRPYYDLTVRRAPGGFVSNHLLDSARPGDRFESTAPSGGFYHSRSWITPRWSSSRAAA